MKLFPLMLASCLLAGCGGGGGGSAGGGTGGGVLPLITNIVARTSPTITYSVTGTYADPSGTRSVTGSMTASSLTAMFVHSVYWPDNSETTGILDVGGTVAASTTRSYALRYDDFDYFEEGARRLGDGADVYWDFNVHTGPAAYDVGDAWDRDTAIVLDQFAYDALTGTKRLFLDVYRWQVAGVADVQVPLGAYQCYVVYIQESYYDYKTGLSTATGATVYVRPEIGPLYMIQNVVVSDGVNSATSTLTVQATAAH